MVFLDPKDPGSKYKFDATNVKINSRLFVPDMICPIDIYMYLIGSEMHVWTIGCGGLNAPATIDQRHL